MELESEGSKCFIKLLIGFQLAKDLAIRLSHGFPLGYSVMKLSLRNSIHSLSVAN